ncbi:MAG: hypothetical protein ACR2NN_04725 [Bryobacteraceae bacterium]
MAKTDFQSVDEYGRVLAAFKDELAPYEVSNGIIRFPLSPAPWRIGLVELMAAAVAALLT